MNQEVRDLLYKQYYSSFKSYISNTSTDEFEKEIKRLKIRYLKFLRDYEKTSKILELGSGGGTFLTLLSRMGFTDITGIDVSDQQITIAEKRGVKVIKSDVFNYLENSELKFDIIIAIDFIEHFNLSELLRLFNLVNTRLNNGGMILIHTPNGQGLFPGKIIYGDLTHQTIFTPNSILQLLHVCNFKDIEFFEAAPLRGNFLGYIRFLLWSLLKIVLNSIKMIESGDIQNIWTQNFICTAKK